MCFDCSKIYKIMLIALAVFLVVLFIFIVINNSSSGEKNPNILVAIARNGDNETLGTTTIKFSQNDIIVGTALSHEAGSDTININESGIYQISYQLYGVQDTTGSFNFNAVLLVNDNALTDTFNESPVIRNSTSNRMTLTSTVILRLQAGDTLS